jgi:hypothetical protein
MAITITTSPNDFIGAFNQVVYTISSNNTAQPNFNFVVDIKQTSTGTLLARLKYPKQPGVTSITFDIGDVLRNSVSYDFNNVVGDLGTNTNSRIKYYVEFRELYDIATVPTLSGVLATNPTGQSASIFKLASNAIFDFEEFTPTAFRNKDVGTIGYLSNSQVENISTNQERFLYWFDPLRLVVTIRYIDSEGSAVETTSISLTALEYLFNIKAGKYAQDTIIAAGGVLTNKYTIQLLGVTDNVLATKTFNLNTECSIYPTVRLHWMNKLGGFDSFNFIRNSTKSEEIERKQFKAPLSIGYNKSDRLKTNFNTTINDTISINSDWINEEQSILLEQLATSPVIYLERSSTDFIAVNITNTNYETKKYLDNRSLFNLSFDLEYTYSRYRQSL